MGGAPAGADGEREAQGRGRVPGKSQRLLCSEATVEDFYAFIEAEKATYPIAWLCRVLKVSRVSFYRWRNPAGPSPRMVRHAQLTNAVTELYEKEKGRAGRDQLTLMLNSAGTKISAPTVGSIMRVKGLRAVRTRAWKTTTVQDPQARTAHIQNHMLDDDGVRDFTSQAPGTRLVGDITYLRTGEGWLFLATVIDLCTGMVIGWSMADHMRASLCTAALTMARDHNHLTDPGTVFHSDRGSQGGFNWSSQHLDQGGARWDVERSRVLRSRWGRGGSGVRIGHCGLRCVPRAGRSPLVRCSGSSGGGSPQG
ncbi:IS3 family transposase [Arthrobacter echini]|uniref:IS3 family transposase n=1 Tax=Arthrobacter echini TaxID=1529066 RepID=A0A4S5E5R3_9MICC|nr:IS3 family transposase [Arthrobacter echini]THJ66782.1 IS3 family transposase [Arthrobacter echini]